MRFSIQSKKMSEIIKELLKENNARERNKQQKSALRNKTLVYLRFYHRYL